MEIKSYYDYSVYLYVQLFVSFVDIVVGVVQILVSI